MSHRGSIACGRAAGLSGVGAWAFCTVAERKRRAESEYVGRDRCLERADRGIIVVSWCGVRESIVESCYRITAAKSHAGAWAMARLEPRPEDNSDGPGHANRSCMEKFYQEYRSGFGSYLCILDL